MKGIFTNIFTCVILLKIGEAENFGFNFWFTKIYFYQKNWEESYRNVNLWMSKRNEKYIYVYFRVNSLNLRY